MVELKSLSKNCWLLHTVFDTMDTKERPQGMLVPSTSPSSFRVTDPCLGAK